MLHAALYLLLALAYCEAATSDFMNGKRRDAFRYAVITAIYGSIAFSVIDVRVVAAPTIPIAAPMTMIG